MPRKTTKPTAKERRAAAAPSEPFLSPDAPPKAVVAPDDGGVPTRVATSEPGLAGGEVSLVSVRGNPSDEAGPSHYEVVHAAVGGNYKGERVEAGTFTDEQSLRLLEAGAIIPLYKAD